MRREDTLRRIYADYIGEFENIPWYHFIKKARYLGIIIGMDECFKRSRFKKEEIGCIKLRRKNQKPQKKLM